MGEWMSQVVCVGVMLCAIDVSIIELNGGELQGEWLPCTQPGHVSVRTKIGEQRLAARDLISVRFDHSPPSHTDVTWPLTVWGTNGSFFEASALRVTATGMVLRTPFARELEVPLNQIAALHWTRHGPVGQDFLRLAHARGAEDVMFTVKEGTVRHFEGTLKNLVPDGGRFAFRGREIEFNTSKVTGVVMAGAPVVVSAPVVCTLHGGFRVTGELVATAGDELLVKSFGGIDIHIPLEIVTELRLASDRSIQLSTLEPARVVQSSFFDEPWPVRPDRAAGGGPLTIRGRTFRTGLGMHARTAVTYDVPDGVKTLAATVGIDDGACHQGRATFKVMAGARMLHTTRELGVDDAPLTIAIDISERRRITLVAEAPTLDLCAHADWGEARFIK